MNIPTILAYYLDRTMLQYSKCIVLNACSKFTSSNTVVNRLILFVFFIVIFVVFLHRYTCMLDDVMFRLLTEYRYV